MTCTGLMPKSRHEQFMSLYNKNHYEWNVKKGERSVSFITGMYERFMKREFAPVKPVFKTLEEALVALSIPQNRPFPIPDIFPWEELLKE